MSLLIVSVPAATLSFGEEFRPVQLDHYCYGYPQGERENDFQFEAKLNQRHVNYIIRVLIPSLMEIIEKHSPSKPTLIFCSTKKGAEQTAHFLANQVQVRERTNGPVPLKDGVQSSVGPFSHPMLKRSSFASRF
jgi:ATP-dependent DNA helicase HFM1/MER3